MFVVTPVYVALAALMFTYLGFRVVQGRRKYRILIGDGGNQDFIWLSRAHGNFTETAPIALIATGAAELAGAPGLLVHACGISLILGRLLHAYSFLKEPRTIGCRQWGMYLTLAGLLVSALAGAGYALHG